MKRLILILLAFAACDDGAAEDVDAAPPDQDAGAEDARVVDAEADVLVEDAAVDVAPEAAPDQAIDAATPTPPSLRILAPVEGAALRGPVEVVVEVSDPDGVAELRLFVDDALVVEQAEGPLPWDSDSSEEGARTLRVEAEDSLGAVAAAEVQVRLDRSAPTLEVLTPEEGARVGPPVSFTVQLEDADEVISAALLLSDEAEEVARLELDLERLAAEWHPEGLASGDYSARLEAIDRAGNVGRSEPRGFTLDRGPEVAFVAPQVDAVVTGEIVVEALVEDDLGVASATLSVDGALVGDLDEAGRIAWVPDFEAGPRELQLEVVDLAGHTARATRAVSVDHAAALALLDCADEPCVPLEGARLNLERRLKVQVEDDDGQPMTLQLFVDDAPLDVLPRANQLFVFSTEGITDGPHQLSVRVIAGDDMGASASAAVHVARCDFDEDGALAPACEGLDCDDLDAAIHPDAEDPPGDELDANCDGVDGRACVGDLDCEARSWCRLGACTPGCSPLRDDCPPDEVCGGEPRSCEGVGVHGCEADCAAVARCVVASPVICPGGAGALAAVEAACLLRCAEHPVEGGLCEWGEATLEGDAAALQACAPDPTDRRRGPGNENAPAARISRLDFTAAAEAPGCPGIGNAGAGFGAFVDLLLEDQDAPFRVEGGRVQAVAVALIEWEEGTRASALEETSLLLQNGGQLPDGAFYYLPETPGPWWPTLFEDATVVDRSFSGVATHFPLPPFLSLRVPGLNVSAIRLSGRLGLDDEGFSLSGGGMSGAISTADVREWVESIAGLCSGGDPPEGCVDLLRLISGDPDVDTPLFLRLLGGTDVHLGAEGIEACAPLGRPCNAISVCGSFELTGIELLSRRRGDEPAGGPCEVDPDCGAGRCLAEAVGGPPGGLCVLGCAAVGECGLDAVCVERRLQCFERCVRDSQCRQSWFCSLEDGACLPGCELTNCLPQEACNLETQRCEPVCEPGCEEDERCVGDNRCVPLVPDCLEAEECAAREACIDGRCVDQPCSVLHGGCDPGEVCRSPTPLQDEGACAVQGPVAPGELCGAAVDCAEPGFCAELEVGNILCYAACDPFADPPCPGEQQCFTSGGWVIGLCL